jgi:hypothetical protein
MPQRVRLSRARGWRMPPNTKKVDRSTRWGNPFGLAEFPDAVERYRAWIVQPEQAELLAQARAALRGKDLACWCALDASCHADVLLDLANT